MRRSTLASIAVAIFLFVAPGIAQESAAWVEVDYSAVLDLRALTHSGQPIGRVLEDLGGRPLPPSAERPQDRQRHVLLDPITEPYAFVLPDLLDTLEPLPQPPLIELAPLWETGAPQPAWVELLRARRYHVESDGAGRMRLILPYNGPPQAAAADAAEQAYRQAWPVLRLVFAAERRRLAQGAESPPPIEVRAHAYMHARQLSLFRLGLDAFEATVEDTRPDGRRSPLDMARLQAFLNDRLQLEGGRLDESGQLQLLGSRAERRPELLGAPVELSDLAVAYRAVFHGGMAEPSMSLERASSPWMTVVTYGGRLRDTRLGMVSLLCDIRFKTFSLGLGIVEGVDLREKVRELLPGFRSHLERFAADPRSIDVRSQQTRLWFYPDNVDVTLSNQGDLLAMRSVRMTATSERVSGGSAGAQRSEDPPWTRATVAAINNDYSTLAKIFPEMADLDQVVRLLAFFTWIREARNLGLAVPELDTLLALELPAVPTPRLFPRLLSFNALPEPGSEGVVDAFDRVPVGEAMERLNPSTGHHVSPRRRLFRVLSALDPGDPENAKLIEEVRGYDLAALDGVTLDDLTYRAERLRLHQTVISTLDRSRREALTARQEAGTQLRVYSVGIGGLDLGMQPVIERARSRSLGLTRESAAQATAVAQQARPAPQREPGSTSNVRDEWRRDPAEIAAVTMPAHGLVGATSREELPGGWIERSDRGDGSPVPRQVWIVLGAYGPEVVSRKVALATNGRASGFERVESGRFLSYRLEAQGDRWRVVATPPPTRAPQSDDSEVTLPDGLALLRIATPQNPEAEASSVELQLDASPGDVPKSLRAGLPRSVLTRLVLGRAVDRTPDRPLPGLDPLPAPLGTIETVMVVQRPEQAPSPWDGNAVGLAGEEDPARIARALGLRWNETGSTETPTAVVGTSLSRSPGRWAAAQGIGNKALLVLPPDAFPGESAALRERLARSWSAGAVVSVLPEQIEASLVVLVSRESAGALARRLHELSRNQALAGKLLAAWSLGGPIRSDLPGALLAEGNLAGMGIAEWSVVGLRTAERQLTEFAGALSAAASDLRVAELPGPFLWYF